MRFYISLFLIAISTFIFFACSSGDSEEILEPKIIPTTIATKAPVKTTVYSEITTGGNITTGNDGFTIIERGIVWSETAAPTISNNKLISSTSSKDFAVTATGLKATTNYYFRSYITSTIKTIYGDEKQIITDAVPSPVAFLPTPDSNKTWVIQPQFTNEFNYEGKTNEFTDNWQDRFFNGWTGARKTVYSASQSSITGGELVYKATIDSDSQGPIVRTGIVTSKGKIGYPLYMEARVKISESSLASAVWMLSEDSTQEIDNLEAYGERTSNYYSDRLHLSHHTFIRSPFQDYQPKGQETYYKDSKGTKWADDYHDYGVLWLDPWTLKYYVDGELVRETPTNQIDPLNYTGGTGLNKDMYLIISAAAQPWRENQGIDYLTDPSVLSDTRSTMRIDWIRTYKPE